MPYDFLGPTGDIGVAIRSETLPGLFAEASAAFTDTITELEDIEPRRPEEVDVDAPDLDGLLVDFLSELLYRFDTRRWLTRHAEVELHEKDGGWSLQGTLRGERFSDRRHIAKAVVKAVSYQGLRVRQIEGVWTARVVFDLDRPEQRS